MLIIDILEKIHEEIDKNIEIKVFRGLIYILLYVFIGYFLLYVILWGSAQCIITSYPCYWKRLLWTLGIWLVLEIANYIGEKTKRQKPLF